MNDIVPITLAQAPGTPALKAVYAPERLPEELRVNGGTVTATIGRDPGTGKQGVKLGDQFIELAPPEWQAGQVIVVTAVSVPQGVSLTIRPLLPALTMPAGLVQLLGEMALKASFVEEALDTAPAPFPSSLRGEIQIPEAGKDANTESLAHALQHLFQRRSTAAASNKLDLVFEQLLGKFQPSSPESVAEQARQRLLPAISLLQNESQQTREAVEGLLKALAERPIAELLAVHSKLEREVVNRLLTTKDALPDGQTLSTCPAGGRGRY